MSYLINRNPPARLQCLHALCKFIHAKYNTTESFKMSDIKYNQEVLNIHSFCEILIEDEHIGINYCRYKENPFNVSGCSLTNGVLDDTTKSKEVSNTVNCLHALGLIDRTGNDLKLTQSGAIFSETEFFSNEMLPIIRNSILKYGPIVGMLYQIRNLNKEEFDTKEIKIGYPSPFETLSYRGEIVQISSGSEKDSNTRTKSCLLAWATTAGFISPTDLLATYDESKPHVSSSSYILKTSRNGRKYKVKFMPNYLFNGSFVTDRPLDYKNLTKNIGALREHNQDLIRELTLKVEPLIQNRRFAILYLLNKAFIKKETLSLKKLVSFLLSYKELFVFNHESFNETIFEEVFIAYTAGIPFSIINDDELLPNNGLNIAELSLNAPVELIVALDKF